MGTEVMSTEVMSTEMMSTEVTRMAGSFGQQVTT